MERGKGGKKMQKEGGKDERTGKGGGVCKI